MPYKDPEKRREAQRKWNKTFYEKNKEQRARITKEERIKSKEFIRNLKEGRPCTDCQVIYPHFVMDFDHVRGDKLFNIAEAANRRLSNNKILQEIAKCELVCANCHRIRTHAPL